MAKKKRPPADGVFSTSEFLANGAASLAESAKEVKTGGGHCQIAAVLFAVFALEAYLNDVGEAKLPVWDIVEPKLSWQQKLELVCRHFEIDLDYGASPFSTLKKLFDFRNKLAHGRTHEVVTSTTDSMNPKWLAECMSDAYVEKVRKDTRAIRKLIQTKSGMPPLGLIAGAILGEIVSDSA